MKKLSLLLCSLLSLFSHHILATENSGFTGNTLIYLAEVKTEKRLTFDRQEQAPRIKTDAFVQISRGTIENVNINNQAQCWFYHLLFDRNDRVYGRPQIDLVRNEISNISQHQTTHYYTIVITKDEYYTCGENQAFYDAVTDKFLTAKEIHQKVQNGEKVVFSTRYNLSNDYVINFNLQAPSNGFSQAQGEVFATYEFDTPNDPITLYDITVDDCHTYKIGKYGFIAHNMQAIANFAFDGAGAVFEGIGVTIGGWAANWQRNRQDELRRAHFENGHITYAAPHNEEPTQPNNPNDQGGPGDPKKSDESNSSKKNGPSPEDIANLVAATKRRRQNLEDATLYQKNQPTIKKADLPEKAKEMFDKYSDNKWQGNVAGQTPGTNAGGKFNNKHGELPVLDANNKPISYNKFDINNRIEGAERDTERFIKGTDGSIYYTNDHYTTLIKVE